MSGPRRRGQPTIVVTSAPELDKLDATRAPLGKPAWTWSDVVNQSGKGQRFERKLDGTIGNCALANSDAESNCQLCGGTCPARDRKDDGYRLPVVVRDPRASARAQVLAVSSAGGPGEVGPDDLVEVTIGRQKFKDYDVGPISIRGRLRRGESLLDGYTRLRAAAAALFELECAERLMDSVVLSGPETFAKHVEGR